VSTRHIDVIDAAVRARPRTTRAPSTE